MGKISIIAGLIILLISSMPILSYQLAKTMETEGLQIKTIPEQCLNQEDSEIISNENYEECLEYLLPSQEIVSAIILLGQNTTEPNLPYRTQIQLNKTGDRILYTAQLYQQQLALGSNPFVIISGTPRANLKGEAENRLETVDIGILLQDLGIPSSQIILESKGFDMRNSAVETAKILEEKELKRKPIFLITSGIYMRRANLTFTNMGLNIIQRPTDFYGFQSNATPGKKIIIKDLLPSASALVTTTEIVDEFFASIYYFLRGWLSPPVL